MSGSVTLVALGSFSETEFGNIYGKLFAKDNRYVEFDWDQRALLRENGGAEAKSGASAQRTKSA